MGLDISRQKQSFLDLAHSTIHREGLDALLSWLSKADFFTAPSSTRFHGAYPGGLCQHSIDVYNYALRAKALYDGELKEENLAVAALFHDVCKVNFYRRETRNQKVNGEWVQVPYYTVEEKFAYGGHGSKSVFLIERFMRLETEEAIAINCHMGFSDVSYKDAQAISSAYRSHPLAWVVHVADEAASYLLDR